MDQLDPLPDETSTSNQTRPDPNSGDEGSFQPSGPQVRPWMRFFARLVDWNLYAIVVGPIMIAIDPLALSVPEIGASDSDGSGFGQYLFFPLILFTFVFVEPLMLSAWGTTPGKAFLKIRLRKKDGSRLNYQTALNRSWEVWIRGSGLGIPIVFVFVMLLAGIKLSKRGITSWDEAGGYRVSHKVIGPNRTMVLMLLTLFVVYVMYQTVAPR